MTLTWILIQVEKLKISKIKNSKTFDNSSSIIQIQEIPIGD